MDTEIILGKIIRGFAKIVATEVRVKHTFESYLGGRMVGMVG